MKNNMNTTENNRNGNGANGIADLGAQEHLTPPETTAGSRRPETNGEKTPTGSPPTTGTAKKRLPRTLAAIAAAAVAVATGVYYFQFVAPFESTDDAFVEGHVTAIASQVPGRVAQLLVQDNQAVNKGDLLLQIDPRDYEARLAQAQANLTAARSQLEQAKSQFSAAQASAQEAQQTGSNRRRWPVPQPPPQSRRACGAGVFSRSPLWVANPLEFSRRSLRDAAKTGCCFGGRQMFSTIDSDAIGTVPRCDYFLLCLYSFFHFSSVMWLIWLSKFVKSPDLQMRNTR